MNRSTDPASRPPPQGDDSTRPQDSDHALLAPHHLRVLAFVVDVSVATLVPLLLVVLGSLSLPELPVPWWSVGLVIVPAGLAGIGGLSVWLTGGLTIGKALTGLALRRVDATSPSPDLWGLAWSLARHSAGYVVVDVLGLGASLALVSPRRRCLHDVVFRCEVVHLPRRAGVGASIQERGEAFSKQLRVGLERASERYGWMTFLLRWWVRVVLVIGSVVFFLFRTSALATAAHTTTPAVSTTAAPSIVGQAGTAAIVASTSAATIALVTVTVPDGQRAYTGLEITAAITVEQPGPAGWDPSTETLFIASGDRLITIDPDTGSVHESDGVARSVSDVMADPDTGTVWVSSRGDGTVAVIDADTTGVIETVSVDLPVDLTHVPGEGIVYVAGYRGTITAIDTTTRAVVQTITLPLRPGTLEYRLGRMAVDPVTGRLYVAVVKGHVGSNYVSVIETATGEEIGQIDVDLDPDGLVVDPVSHNLFVTDELDSLRVVDTGTNAMLDTLSVNVSHDSHGEGSAMDLPAGTIAVLSVHDDLLTVIDAASRRVIDTISFDRQPTEVEVDSDTGTVFVSAYYDDTVYVLRPR